MQFCRGFFDDTIIDMKTVFHINMRLLLLALLIIALGAAGYLGYQNYLLLQRNAELETELAQTQSDFVSTTRNLEASIASLEEDLGRTISERDNLEQNLRDEEDKVDTLNAKVENLTGAVETLEKLSKTDPELLKKYSKVFFLNEHYVPAKLVGIDEQYIYDKKEELFIHGDVWPHLQNLLTDAAAEGVDIKIISAYRSFGTQSQLKSSYNVTYGAGTANQFSADQGYSEHQLGTTVDFTTSATGAAFSAFEKTPTYPWLTENAHEYGFILSYSKGNAYYRFEPWHWRFVGKILANALHAQDLNFYDVAQRIIDDYLVSFFD